jgi:hypothetical protein
MAKLIVQHDTDPGIAVIFDRMDADGEPIGSCTQCPFRTIPGYDGLEGSAEEAKIHVDLHEAADA